MNHVRQLSRVKGNCRCVFRYKAGEAAWLSEQLAQWRQTPSTISTGLMLPYSVIRWVDDSRWISRKRRPEVAGSDASEPATRPGRGAQKTTAGAQKS